MSSAPTPPPTGLDHLVLTNYRCFPELSIDFHPNLTVVVAPNGRGKTAILDAVAVAWRLFVDTIQTRAGGSLGFHHDDIRKQLSADRTMEAMIPTTLSATGRLDGTPLEWSRALESDKKGAKTTYSEASNLKDAAARLRHTIQDYADKKIPTAPTLPLIAYYGTGRLFGAHKLTSKKKVNAETSRLAGYEDCLTSASRYKYFEDWFERFSKEKAMESRSGTASLHSPAQKLSAVRTAVDALLAPSGWANLQWDFAEDQIMASHAEHGTLPVEYLSDGIRNMIGMVGDIAHRCTRLNPQHGEKAPQLTHGIVLIDEVDMHLHPNWQQTVVQSLRDAFPLIQFIVTTHSPQVLTTVPSECIRILDEGAVCAAPSGTDGAEAQRLLKDILGVEPRPDTTMSRKLRRYMELVHDHNWSCEEAVSLRSELDAWSQGEEPRLKAADLTIANLKWGAST